jgi:hypothetical protein
MGRARPSAREPRGESLMNGARLGMVPAVSSLTPQRPRCRTPSWRTPLQRRFLSLAFVAAFVALCLVACSGQSEGQRCSTNDDPGGSDNSPGTSDCATGYRCDPAGSLGGAAAQYASEQTDPSFGICCPYDRTKATTSICALQPSPPNSDAAPPADSGASDAPTSDAPAETDSGDGGSSPDGGNALLDAPAG